MNKPFKISVVIPCYNEEFTLKQCVDRLVAIDFSNPIEVIIVDDGSTDNSAKIMMQLASNYPEVKYLSHPKKCGKGVALKTGFSHVNGDIIVIQDADLEYNPKDIIKLLEPIIDGRADVVFGTRFSLGDIHRVLYFWHSIANKLITLFCNIFSNLNLSDIEVCYKAFTKDILKQLTLKEKGFGFEPEFTIKVSRLHCRIYETGISYDGRTFAEGKKIGFCDAVRAFWVIFKYGFLKF